jgi:hypothetical protein
VSGAKATANVLRSAPSEQPAACSCRRSATVPVAAEPSAKRIEDAHEKLRE